MPSDTVTHHRSIFISDFHIGAKTFNAPALLDFLKRNECETLYLVGDIIDGWKLQKRWLWTETTNQIFDELARKADMGTQIIYLPGNHDDAVRFIPVLKRLRFTRHLGIKITNSIIHKTADDRKFLVMHGDQFDTKILSEPVLKAHHKASDWLNALFQKFTNQEQTYIEINGQVKRFSLAKYLSKHGRLAIQALNNFEGLVYKTVQSKHADGIICGHTHVSCIKAIKDIVYINTGSWLRSGNTAVVEDYNGQMTLLDWDDVYGMETDQLAFPIFAQTETNDIHFYPDAIRYRPVTELLVKKIKKLWAPQSETAIAPQTMPNILITRIETGINSLISLPTMGTLVYDNNH
ncbi:MAG: UDP-2,3-diacylglucosamine diphosphatase [Pseudomonadota bacterium]